VKVKSSAGIPFDSVIEPPVFRMLSTAVVAPASMAVTVSVPVLAAPPSVGF
jgi:hypothetical protein